MVNGRYERKFFISELTMPEIEKIVKLNPLIFSEIFHKRRVNNIYLDSRDMENYIGNLVGNTERLKIRIRWYGRIFGLIQKPILELKIKKGEIGEKMSFPLKEFRLDKDLSIDFLQKEIFAKSNLPIWLVEKLKLFNLSLLNCYERKYFTSTDKKFRITLDNNLMFYEIKERNNSFKYRIEDIKNNILEVKYSQENDWKFSQITQDFPFRLTKSSKYIMGIEILKEV
jgi:SPX domain protein involved in polyphosphate accumulation